MTQQQIEVMTGILEGREFTCNGAKFVFQAKGPSIVMYDEDEREWVASGYLAGHFLALVLEGKITLVPTPLITPENDPVRKLVDALENLALCGFEEFGGSWVNLQVDKQDVLNAREALAAYRKAMGEK